jgi:hypothetical protein
MSTVNLPHGFDFTDPDLYASRLPVADRAVPLGRISTHLARSSGSHTNTDTLVGMP